MSFDNFQLEKLNAIYRKILNRDVDPSGISSYIRYMNSPTGHQTVEKDLYASKEYRDKLHKKNLAPKELCAINGVVLKKKPIHTKNISIMLLSLVKDCTYNNSLQYVQTFITDLKDRFKTIKFGIYTNNNHDNTLNALHAWQSQDKDIFVFKGDDERLTDIKSNNCGNRIPKLSEYRATIFKKSIEHFQTKFDYVIVFDSDICANMNIEPLIESLSVDDNWSAISSNNCFKHSNIHYDTLALRLLEQPLDISTTYPKFLSHYGKTYDWNHTLYIFDNFVEVQSAFGGLTIYRADELLSLFEKYDNPYLEQGVPDCTCEHTVLSLKLKNKKYINANMRFTNKETKNSITNTSPKMFIPRDAGFFSVFNFLIGSIAGGNRIYPFFNKQQFLTHRKTNDHFCYWTTNENAWFDFFEPISFYPNDIEHLNNRFINYEITGGEEASKEFKEPSELKSLLKGDKTRLDNWRLKMHNIYKHHIKPKEELIVHVDSIFNKMFGSAENIIGVHYRHPSHSVESGPIFLQQYFDIIDDIIIQNPDTKIFLASDTKFGILAFEDKYQDRIKYIENIDRLPLDNILAWAYALIGGKPDTVGFINNKGYELQHLNSNKHSSDNYDFTKNLLTEILCLSKCHTIINSTSNISLALGYINPFNQMITL